MYKAPLIIVLAVLLTSSLIGAKQHAFQTGKLMGIASDERVLEGPHTGGPSLRYRLPMLSTRQEETESAAVAAT